MEVLRPMADATFAFPVTSRTAVPAAGLCGSLKSMEEPAAAVKVVMVMPPFSVVSNEEPAFRSTTFLEAGRRAGDNVTDILN